LDTDADTALAHGDTTTNHFKNGAFVGYGFHILHINLDLGDTRELDLKGVKWIGISIYFFHPVETGVGMIGFVGRSKTARTPKLSDPSPPSKIKT